MGALTRFLRDILVNILITGTTYPPALNGQSIFTANLAEGLARHGHTVYLVTNSERGQAYRCERNGVHIWAISATEMRFFHNQAYVNLFPRRQAAAVFAHCSPDVVHLHDHYPLSQSVLAEARQRGIPVIGTNHFVPENLAPYVPLLPRIWPLFNRLLWWWMKRVYDHLDLVTAPSRTAVQILAAQRLHAPLRAISCGVDLGRFHPDPLVDRAAVRRQFGLDERRTTFLFVGRVDAEKKVDVLIRAVGQLRRDDIQLAVAGKGAALHRYQELATSLNLADQVRFTGFVPEDDLPRLLNSVEIFSMPSEAELLSIASLEAMASGLPLLVARAKALPELVREGEDGRLFEPGNVDDAARAMAALADPPADWPAMGAASLARVQPHGLENVIRGYEELYRGCLAQAGRSLPPA
jgi:1,2-diacylglycerol 3-alpha-glucosyltransferase